MTSSRITAGDVAGTIALFLIFLLGAFFACLLDGDAMAAPALDCAPPDRDDEIIRGFAIFGMLALGGHVFVAIMEWGRGR